MNHPVRDTNGRLTSPFITLNTKNCNYIGILIINKRK